MAQKSLTASDYLSSHEVVIDFDDTVSAYAEDVFAVGGDYKVETLHVADAIGVFDVGKFSVSH